MDLKIFKNGLFEVGVTLEDGSVLFDAEMVARCLGFTTVAKSGNEVVRWARVNEYLGGNLPDVAKGDLIPESMVYKLAFKASNETAEKFQDWLAIDVIPQIRKTGGFQMDISNLSPELQLMNSLVQAMNKQALEQKKLEGVIQETKDDLQNIRDVVEIKPFENWRETTNKLINKMAYAKKNYEEIKTEIYKALDSRAGTKINTRLENMKDRASRAGMSRSRVEALTNLAVIGEDKKLIEIYTAIVKEMAIKKGVTV